MKHLEPSERLAPPPPEWGAPPNTKVALVYYFDLKGDISDRPVPGGGVEIVYWADDNLKQMVGSVHGTVD